jgi:hypothetical protein
MCFFYERQKLTQNEQVNYLFTIKYRHIYKISILGVIKVFCGTIVIRFQVCFRIVQLTLVVVTLMLPQSPSIMVAGMCLAIPVAATASSMAVDMAAYSYISDTTAEKVPS